MVYRPRWTTPGSDPMQLPESESKETPEVQQDPRRERRINELIIESINNLHSLQPEKIKRACDKFRVIANYFMSWAIEDTSLSDEMTQVMRRTVIRPASKYMRVMNAELDKFTDDEWTVFNWKLKDMINGTDWMDDMAACMEGQNKMVKAFQEVIGPTADQTDYNFIRREVGAIYDVSQSMAEWFKSDTPGLVLNPDKLPPIDPDALQVYSNLPDAPEDWTKYTRDRGPWLFGIGGLEWWKEYVNWDLVMYRLVILKETAATGVTEVDAALNRLGAPKGVRTILMALAVGMAGAGLAWAGGLSLGAEATGGPVVLHSGFPLIGSRIGPFIWNAWPVVQGAVSRVMASQAVKFMVARSTVTAIAKAGFGYYGASVFAQFILEEALQQYSFGLSKLYSYQWQDVDMIADKIDALIEERWKTWIPVYGAYWSLDKYFLAAGDFSEIMRRRASIQKQKNLKRKQSTIGKGPAP